MSAREKLDQAIREYVEQIEHDNPPILATNWVLGWETTHLNPEPDESHFLHAHDWTHSDGLSAAGAVGLSALTAGFCQEQIMGFGDE